MTTNTWKRRAPAIAAVLLLSVPSAIGVQRALAPTRGDAAGWLAAAGFELVYLSTAVLMLSTDLRRYAQRVALGAVLSAITLNTIADYAARVPGGLVSTGAAWARFDGLALSLSLIESLPLAGLAYAMAALLHRMGETQDAPEAAPPRAVLRPALAANAEPIAETLYETVQTDGVRSQNVQTLHDRACKYCGAAGLSATEVARHGRQRKRTGRCGE